MKVRDEISTYMPVERFVEIHLRLGQLRKEEEDKLTALADLQKMYVAANHDSERESIRVMVGKIRDLSKKHREEIRALNQEIIDHMPFEKARELYEKLTLNKNT